MQFALAGLVYWGVVALSGMALVSWHKTWLLPVWLSAACYLWSLVTVATLVSSQKEDESENGG